MTSTGESHSEASRLMHLLTMKAKTRIGTWNVRTMYETGRAAQIANEMRKYKLEVLGISESRWNGSGMTRLATKETIIYSGHTAEDAPHTEGVAIMLSESAAKSMMEWEPVSSRIITARFNSKGRKVTIIQCYAPTNVAEEETKETFYEELQSTLDKAPKRDMKIVMGDMNAKIGSDNTGKELVMGKQALGEMNNNGEMFTDFCSFNELVIGGSVFKHKTIHKETWISPDGRTKNQIDFIAIARKWRRSLEDTRSMRGADVASDHHLVMGVVKIKLRAFKDTGDRPHIKFNTQKLKDKETRDTFCITIKNKFEALNSLTEETPLEEQWNDIKKTFIESCQETLGKREFNMKPWMSTNTWKLIEERRKLKDQINCCTNEEDKNNLRRDYTNQDKEVKKSSRKDKRDFNDALATEAEEAAGKRDLSTLYKVTKTLSGKNFSNSNKPVKDQLGNSITKEHEQRERWAEHFKELLNRPPPEITPDIPPADTPLNVNLNPPSRTEIMQALKALKNGKAAGPDGIPPEALKMDLKTTTDLLQPLLQKVWKEQKIPEDWKKGHLVKLPKKGDLGLCKNWRGIMLLSVPSKVLTRILLERLKKAIDLKLRPEQAGFRQDHSCTDQIATLRIIIEQSLEWQSTLYLNFIDFQKAFDSVDRNTIWKIFDHFGIPVIFKEIIKQLYDNATCQVIHNGKLTQPFNVETGVRQGCLLSPMIFLMVVDWIMREATKDNNTGLQWTFTRYLEDLDFADDLCLLSQKQQHMQQKTDRLTEEAAKTGLQVNIDKTEVMRMNSKQLNPINLGGNNLKEVEKFTYLGSIVTTHGGSDEDIQARINKARNTFVSLKPVWNSSVISRKNKIRIFNTNVKSVLLYGSETWRVTETLTKKIQTFINRCLRQILKIRWPDTISNQDLWNQTNQDPINQQISRRKWKWIGHTMRKPINNITRQALQWNPQGKRKVGRPLTSWRRSCEEEMKRCGQTWGQVTKIAQNRVRWRVAVEALCSTRNKRN